MKWLRTSVGVVAVLMVAFTIYIGLYMGKPWVASPRPVLLRWLGFFWFLGFSLTPYVTCFLVARFLLTQVEAVGLFLIGTMVISLYGIHELMSAAFWHLNPQSALVFIFLPGAQWGALIVLSAISVWIEWLEHRLMRGR
jgi:hypothetical protein